MEWLFDQVSKAQAQIQPAKLETDRPGGQREREREEGSSLLPAGTALPSAVAKAGEVHLHTPGLLVTAATVSTQTWGHANALERCQVLPHNTHFPCRMSARRICK